MIDIHCHILPGIDDGAENLAESVAMGRMAREDGCEVIFATPHQRHPYWWNDDGDVLAALRDEVSAGLGGAPRILAGAEVRVDSEVLDDLEAGRVTPLGASRYLLVEFARSGIGPDPEDIVHEMVVAGWRPILAHPELLPWIADDLVERQGEGLFIDCAVYGKKNNHPELDYSEMLERKTHELDGIKTLISRNHYTRESFWSVYNRPNYDAAKARLDPHGVFPNLFDKFHKVS